MKSLFSLWRALRVSKVLDDRTDRSRRAGPEFGEQGRVDAELADAQRLPWRKPSTQVRSRVLLEIEAKRYRHRRVSAWPVWPLRAAALAALALLVWGLPVWNGGMSGPAAVSQAELPEVIRVASEPSIGDQLRDEADAIGEDTRRAAEMLLGRLPFAGY